MCMYGVRVLLYILHTCTNTYYQPSQMYKLCSWLRYLVVTLWFTMMFICLRTLVNIYWWLLVYPREIDSFMYYTCTDCRYDFDGLLQQLSRSKVMSLSNAGVHQRHSASPHWGPNSLSSSMESIGCNWRKLCGISGRSELPNHLQILTALVLWNDLPTTRKWAKLNLVFSHFLYSKEIAINPVLETR